MHDRIELYREIERYRKRPLIVYCTNSRRGSEGAIAGDVVPQFLSQLHQLPVAAKSVDLLIISDGGDATVAWRIVSLIRERVKHLSVLVPQAAFSAATLIALGADEIVMHPHGNLGPTDPQIRAPRPGRAEGTSDSVHFGAEDLSAFLNFARDSVGLTDQAHLLEVLKAFSSEVGAVPIGVAARSAQLSLSMGERLLMTHMNGIGDDQKAKAISATLTKDFSHHGYPVSRSEAKQIGLKIADEDSRLESLMWGVWLSVAEEFQIETQWTVLSELMKNTECAALFGAVPHALNVPANLPADAMQQVIQQLLAKVQVTGIPPVDYALTHALVESIRSAAHFESHGKIFAARLPDLSLRTSVQPIQTGWMKKSVSGRKGKRKGAVTTATLR